MYYCCKCCKDSCSCCTDCIDSCFSGCCECLGSCCGECCEAIHKCFQTPFSLCTFLSFFITVIPTIIMIAALSKSSDVYCEVDNLKVHLLVQGINNAINFIFCLYLVVQYGKKYKSKKSESKPNAGPNNNGQEEKNILQRTINLIMYDCWVLLYICLLIFFVVWNIMGHVYLSEEINEKGPCKRENDGIIVTADYINICTMWAFLIIGAIAFILTLIINACDEGR